MIHLRRFGVGLVVFLCFLFPALVITFLIESGGLLIVIGIIFLFVIYFLGIAFTEK